MCCVSVWNCLICGVKCQNVWTILKQGEKAAQSGIIWFGFNGLNAMLCVETCVLRKEEDGLIIGFLIRQKQNDWVVCDDISKHVSFWLYCSHNAGSRDGFSKGNFSIKKAPQHLVV